MASDIFCQVLSLCLSSNCQTIRRHSSDQRKYDSTEGSAKGKSLYRQLVDVAEDCGHSPALNRADTAIAEFSRLAGHMSAVVEAWSPCVRALDNWALTIKGPRPRVPPRKLCEGPSTPPLQRNVIEINSDSSSSLPSPIGIRSVSAERELVSQNSLEADAGSQNNLPSSSAPPTKRRRSSTATQAKQPKARKLNKKKAASKTQATIHQKVFVLEWHEANGQNQSKRARHFSLPEHSLDGNIKVSRLTSHAGGQMGRSFGNRLGLQAQRLAECARVSFRR